MRPARIIILAVAIGAAGLAGLLAMQLAAPRDVVQPTKEVVRKEPTINVLVSSENLPVGSRLNEKSIHWMAWPEGSIVEGFITERNRPNAITELTGQVVRLPMFVGEPLRAEKVADSSNRILSSLLPSGKRAIATEISAMTGAGGFVLPNDRVDVIMVRKNEEGRYATDYVLNNIRVLAIDQRIEEKEDGTKTVLGSTATLELTPDQARIMAVAQQMAERLTLALRSVADAQDPDSQSADYLLKSADGKTDVQVIKSGSIVKASSLGSSGSSSGSSSSSSTVQR